LDTRDVLTRCALCPGICVASCPIYRLTKIRAFAPNNLARIALRFLNGESGYAEALWACTLCGACTDNCPLENPLGETLRIVRGLSASGGETTRIEPILISDSSPGYQVLFLTRKPPSNRLMGKLGLEHRVFWLNSDLLYSVYYNGLTLNPDLRGYHVIIHEDYDAAAPLSRDDKSRLMHSVEFMHLKHITLTLDTPYILHIPCKVQGELNENIVTGVMGEPSKTIKTCLGGGGGFPEAFPVESLEVAKGVLGGEQEPVIVTLCERARDLLLRLGYRVYTPLDLLAGGY